MCSPWNILFSPMDKVRVKEEKKDARFLSFILVTLMHVCYLQLEGFCLVLCVAIIKHLELSAI